MRLMIEINLNLLISRFEYLDCQNVFTWCFEISANYTGGGVNLIFDASRFHVFCFTSKNTCAHFGRCFSNYLCFLFDFVETQLLLNALHA